MAFIDGPDGFLGEGLDLEEPLLGEAWLDDDAGALAGGDGEVVVLDLDQQPKAVEILDDLLAGGEAVEAVVGRARKIDMRGLIHDGEAGQDRGARRWRSR